MKIIILGNSIAAIRFIEEIRRINPQSEIILFTFEEERVIARDCFISLLAQQKPLDSLYYRESDFYQKCNVRLIKEDKPERINFNRGQLSSLSKEKLAFDFIVLDETGQNQWPAIRGTQKTGIFALRRLGDLTQILGALPLAETITVVSDTLWGLKTACALKRTDKEIFLVTSWSRLLENLFDEETSRIIYDNIDKFGIRLLCSQQVKEILGDTDLKAVRLDGGKVISSQMVIYPDSSPDLKIFKDTGLEYKETIAVNSSFQTNLDNALAINRSISIRAETHEQYSSIMAKQGEVIAASIVGEKQDFEYPVIQGSIKLENFDMQFLGKCEITESTQVVTRFDQNNNSCLKLFLENQKPVGAIFINWEQDRQKIKDMILHPEHNLQSLEIFNGAWGQNAKEFQVSEELAPQTDAPDPEKTMPQAQEISSSESTSLKPEGLG